MNFCRTLSIKQQLMVWAMVLLSLTSPVDAGKISLQWGRSSDPGVTGYRVRVAQASTGTTKFVDVGNTNEAVVDLLLEGQIYNVTVTAYTTGGLESDPSNPVSYTIPAFSGPTYSLQFGRFTKGTAEYSPHGTLTANGDAFAAGTVVKLTAYPASGYICNGWTINGVTYAGNPMNVTMNQNTLVTPVIKKRNGPSQGDPAGMSLQLAGGPADLSVVVGGEMGAWILEGSMDFKDWNQIATGLTSQQVSLPLTRAYAFYRARSAELVPLN